MSAPVRRRRIQAAARRRARKQRITGPMLISATALLLMAVVWLSQHPRVLIAAATALAAGAIGFVYFKMSQAQRRIVERRTVADYRQLNPTQFEHALADLCRRDGCTRVTVVGGAGDLAADVLATTPDGRRILIQAKRYGAGNPVRSPAMQAVNGTYQAIHGADLAAVVTTSSFTPDAAAFGRRVGLRMFAEAELAAWASKTGPAPWVG